MPDVLNPLLYRKLKQHFGVVRVSNPGQAMSATAVLDFVSKKPRLNIAHPGEYYQVCCPYCHDSRFRLYVNHMYGKKDSFGRKMTFLAICYNDTACMSDDEKRDDLHNTLEEMDGVLERAKVLDGEPAPAEAREVDWPGPCIPLAQLKSDHPAIEYIRSRHFDPAYIGKQFDVRYCVDSHFFLARNRLIIPVYERGKLKGWQARYCGELEWKNKSLQLPPKYFTMPNMPRRLLLYNFDKAKEHYTGVIMEGPTDVWAMGAVGATMTTHQQRRFTTIFQKRSAVLLYDPEEFDDPATQRLVENLRSHMPNNLAVIKLPDGTDPGSLSREFLRDYVFTEAKKQGVKVSYKKVKK